MHASMCPTHTALPTPNPRNPSTTRAQPLPASNKATARLTGAEPSMADRQDTEVRAVQGGSAHTLQACLGRAQRWLLAAWSGCW